MAGFVGTCWAVYVCRPSERCDSVRVRAEWERWLRGGSRRRMGFELCPVEIQRPEAEMATLMWLLRREGVGTRPRKAPLAPDHCSPHDLFTASPPWISTLTAH